MSKNQNNYPLEFKTSAVKLAVESDQSVAQIARDLGINDNTPQVLRTKNPFNNLQRMSKDMAFFLINPLIVQASALLFVKY